LKEKSAVPSPGGPFNRHVAQTFAAVSRSVSLAIGAPARMLTSASELSEP